MPAAMHGVLDPHGGRCQGTLRTVPTPLVSAHVGNPSARSSCDYNAGMVMEFEKPSDHVSYVEWARANQTGFVMNKSLPADQPGALTLHRADCGTIYPTPSHGQSFIGISKKYCANKLADLENYARTKWDATPGRCGRCL
jgi:hypothetical protein